MKDKKGKQVANSKKKPTATISQELLAEYRHLSELCRRKDQLRKEILALLESGAAVELGELDIALHVKEKLFLSWPKLRAILSEAHVQHIRANIEPSQVCCLKVVHPDDGLAALVGETGN